ncbi:unnamed protein product [Trichobilharzia szidati]|nr:unnamed protein product [Trichobilharzia szidati]
MQMSLYFSAKWIACLYVESDESDCDTENSALSTESDSEAQVYTPYLLVNSENVEQQQQGGDMRNNSRKDSVNPSRNRQRPCGKGRGSANTTPVLSQSSLNLPTCDSQMHPIVCLRSSRRGILSRRAPYDSRTRLPPGVYYSHKEFLRMCNSTPEECTKEMNELNATLLDLSNPLEEQIKELVEKEKKVLDGI